MMDRLSFFPGGRIDAVEQRRGRALRVWVHQTGDALRRQDDLFDGFSKDLPGMVPHWARSYTGMRHAKQVGVTFTGPRQLEFSKRAAAASPVPLGGTGLNQSGPMESFCHPEAGLTPHVDETSGFDATQETSMISTCPP
jgi:hypothetical protein